MERHTRPGHRRALAMLAVVIGAMAPAASASKHEKPSVEAVRQSFDVKVEGQPSITVIEGRRVSMFEIHLTNFAGEPLSLDGLSIIDDRKGQVFEAHGSDLFKRLAHIGSSRPAAGGEIAPGARAVIFLEIALGESLPAWFQPRIEYRAGSGSRHILIGERLALSSEKPLLLGPPVREGPWAAVRDPGWERGHRRVFYTIGGRARLPGRYAIDWVKLDDAGRQGSGDPDKLTSAFGYGQAVIAVADGEVVAVRTDVEEAPLISANRTASLEDAAGNFVVLRIGQDRYAIYEHLKPGSIRVSRGDRVRRGAEIAQVGSTGDSTGPHLHFHVADGPEPLSSEGVPFAFETYELLGHIENFGTFGSAPWRPVRDGLRSRRNREAPGMNAVVLFERQENGPR